MIIKAVSLVRGESLFLEGPATSAVNNDIPPPPINGINDNTITTIPIPPIQLVKLRQKRILFGSLLRSGIMVALVVVKPEIHSKKESEKLGI